MNIKILVLESSKFKDFLIIDIENCELYNTNILSIELQDCKFKFLLNNQKFFVIEIDEYTCSIVKKIPNFDIGLVIRCNNEIKRYLGRSNGSKVWYLDYIGL